MSDLIDRQALKDYVSSLSTHPLNEWDTWGVLAAIDKQPTVNPWHRVEERLPNVGELVVGLDADGHPEITMLSESKCWLTYGLYIHNLGCYVWWMPLPEPPKEEEHGN